VPPEALEADDPPLPAALEAAVEGAGAAAGSGAGAGAAAVTGAGAGAGLVAAGDGELLLAPLPLSVLPHPASAKSTARATGMVRCRMESAGGWKQPSCRGRRARRVGRF
jgi:hypothetical protein